jgi:signal transduction histidine kinase
MTEESLGQIRFAADILRRLGEELNPSMDQGIIELVKNAYDADAINCVVQITHGVAGDEISIADDGVGMTASDVTNGWLVLGSSTKSTRVQTPLGRNPAGNKGLGRLAALRLGAIAQLETSSDASGMTTTVELDWERFEGVGTVDEVPVPITVEDSDGRPAGTRIRLSKLRARVGRMDVKRLARAMILLADPFSDSSTSFRPRLEAEDFEDLSRLVSTRYFDDSEYHLVAKLVDGRAEAKVVDWKGNVLYESNHEEIRRTGQNYLAPDAEFDLWAFSLNSRTFATRTTSLGEVREWLSQFGGVHVYSNGLRVAPYGNPGSDWLDMNVARARSPEERPSTNNSIGRVSIHDPEGLLPQKTDRSGFIEEQAFIELRQFAADSLDWMARQRVSAAEARRRQARIDTEHAAATSQESVRREIEKADPANRSELKTAFNRYAKDRDREAAVLRNEVQLYRTLSTAGITTATFAHESNGGPIKVITQSLGAVARRGRAHIADYDSVLGGPVASIERAISTLSVLAQATLRLVDQDKRRIGRVELHDVVKQTLETLAPFFEGRDVKIELALAEGVPFLRGSEAAIESVLTNLLNNSVVAFETATTVQRTIRVETLLADDEWRLVISDNGPGIEGISIREVWLPGETRRPGGTGLGLTIVRDAVADLSGSVEAVAHGPLGGATFTVRLPILGR